MATDKQTKNTLAPGMKPWKAGQSGNPKGRPKKDCSLTSLLKKELEKHPEVNGVESEFTWRELLVQSWLKKSLNNPVLFKEILDRIEGKVMQPIAGEDGGPIAHSVNIHVHNDNAKKLTEDILSGKGTT